MSDLTQNLIPTGTLIGTLAVGAGTTDYNVLENKPSINNVMLAGNKTALDLGFATVATTGSYEDLGHIPRYEYTINLGLNTAHRQISDTNISDVLTVQPVTVPIEKGAYGYILMINAKWTGNSYQFYAGINIDGTDLIASNSFSQEQGNSTLFFVRDINIPNTGNHTIKPICYVSNANKVVDIMPYTSVMLILLRRA